MPSSDVGLPLGTMEEEREALPQTARLWCWCGRCLLVRTRLGAAWWSHGWARGQTLRGTRAYSPHSHLQQRPTQRPRERAGHLVALAKGSCQQLVPSGGLVSVWPCLQGCTMEDGLLLILDIRLRLGFQGCIRQMGAA